MNTADMNLPKELAGSDIPKEVADYKNSIFASLIKAIEANDTARQDEVSEAIHSMSRLRDKFGAYTNLSSYFHAAIGSTFDLQAAKPIFEKLVKEKGYEGAISQIQDMNKRVLTEIAGILSTIEEKKEDRWEAQSA